MGQSVYTDNATYGSDEYFITQYHYPWIFTCGVAGLQIKT